jgi:hypothetical protein
MFAILDRLPEGIAFQWFTGLHLPLLVLLLWLSGHPAQNVRFWFQAGLDFFLIIHLGLHLLL